jgi:hypothetical protein
MHTIIEKELMNALEYIGDEITKSKGCIIELEASITNLPEGATEMILATRKTINDITMHLGMLYGEQSKKYWQCRESPNE